MWRVEELGSDVVGVVRKLQVAVLCSHQILLSSVYFIVYSPSAVGLEGGQGGGRKAKEQ